MSVCLFVCLFVCSPTEQGLNSNTDGEKACEKTLDIVLVTLHGRFAFIKS